MGLEGQGLFQAASKRGLSQLWVPAEKDPSESSSSRTPKCPSSSDQGGQATVDAGRERLEPNNSSRPNPCDPHQGHPASTCVPDPSAGAALLMASWAGKGHTNSPK